MNNTPTDKPFPRWFLGNNGILRKFSSPKIGTYRLHGEWRRSSYTMKDAEYKVYTERWRELTQQEAEEILRGEKHNQ